MRDTPWTRGSARRRSGEWAGLARAARVSATVSVGGAGYAVGSAVFCGRRRTVPDRTRGTPIGVHLGTGWTGVALTATLFVCAAFLHASTLPRPRRHPLHSRC